jgi:hypothetical protein
LMSEIKLWSIRHGQILDARSTLDSTYSGQLGLLLCSVLGLASALNILLFINNLGFDNMRTECVWLDCQPLTLHSKNN